MNDEQVKNLEKKLFESIEDKTPEYIKALNLIDLSKKGEFDFELKREHLKAYDKDSNPEGLGLLDWFANYEKEAKVSTAGIRGPQNILYPQDTRFPINLIGIVLATVAKGLVAVEKYKDKTLIKLSAHEVRYNSPLFMEAITRIQAGLGIKTIVPTEKKTIPIWLASFLVFKLGLLGGEYITSSHGISVKNATKDLNFQGSQYLPEESMEFVNKIREIFKETEKNGSYKIHFAPSDSKLIDEELMKKINDGIDIYVEYLKTGVGREQNINLIKESSRKNIIENVGGSAYRTLSRVLEKFGIANKFDWLDTEEDAFFHGIGKTDTDPKGNKCFYDYSVDATVLIRDTNGNPTFPVIDSMDYAKRLAKYPIGTIILITDPDHDRLTITQIENNKNQNELDKTGISYLKLDKDRILTVYTANQAFLMLMNFRASQLKKLGLWEKHPRFIIKTTASTKAWDDWAKTNNINIVNVPVGFKEIANIMKKVELQEKQNPEKDVVVLDVLSKEINLGKHPRLLFAGEESGGMIMGPDDLISSPSGIHAIAMREKSATEAIIVSSALGATLEKENILLSKYLKDVFENNKVISKFDTRCDIAYYNESEPDINKMKAAKKIGEEKRTKNDLFYLSMAIGLKEGILTTKDIEDILNNTFKDLKFSDILDIKFVGDGTYIEFKTKFLEIRPSGTDAKTKAYAAGEDRKEIERYAQALGNYSGERTTLHKKFISDNFYNKTKDIAMKYYLQFVNDRANNESFNIPDYNW